MDKDYEEYIAELETELSDAKRERDTYKRLMQAERTETRLLRHEKRNMATLDKRQDAITAWSMGFE